MQVQAGLLSPAQNEDLLLIVESNQNMEIHTHKGKTVVLLQSMVKHCAVTMIQYPLLHLTMISVVAPTLCF